MLVLVKPAFIGVALAFLIPAALLLVWGFLQWRAAAWRPLGCATGVRAARRLAEREGEDLPPHPSTCCLPCAEVSSLSPYVLAAVLLVSGYELAAVGTGNATRSSTGELTFVHSFLATSWVFLGLNALIWCVLVFVLTEPDEPFSVAGMLRLLLKAHGMDVPAALTAMDKAHVLTKDAATLLDSEDTPLDVALRSASASPSTSFNALYEACTDPATGSLALPRGIRTPSRQHRELVTIQLYIASLVVLVAYIGTNFLAGGGTAESGTYVAVALVGTMLLVDCVVWAAYAGGTLTTSGATSLLVALSRGVAIAFGVRFWLIGIMATYLLVGVFLAEMLVLRAFPSLREWQATGGCQGRPATLKPAPLEGPPGGEAAAEAGVSAAGGEQGADRGDREQSTCLSFVTHPGTLLLAVSAAFAALVGGLAVASESDLTLPTDRVTLVDSSRAHPQWQFGLAAIGFVAVFTPLRMAFLFYDADSWDFKGVGWYSAALSCTVSAAVGVGLWRITDSFILLGFCAFAPIAVFGLAGLWGQFQRDDFDVWLPGGIGCVRTCACCYTKYQQDHEQKVMIHDMQVAFSARGIQVQDDVTPRSRPPEAPRSFEERDDSELVEDTGIDDGEGGADERTLAGAASDSDDSDSDMEVFVEEPVESGLLPAQRTSTATPSTTIAQWHAEMTREGSNFPQTAPLLPGVNDTGKIWASTLLAVHYPCPGVPCCRPHAAGCTCAPEWNGNQWRNNYVMLAFSLIVGAFAGFGYVMSLGLTLSWVGWFVAGEAFALVMMGLAVYAYIRTAAFNWFHWDFMVLGVGVHILEHVYAFLRLGSSSVTNISGYGVLLSAVLVPFLFLLAAAFFSAAETSFADPSTFSKAVFVFVNLLVVAMAVAGVVVAGQPTAVGAALAVYLVFLVALVFYMRFKSNGDHMPRRWAMAGNALLCCVLVAGIALTVVSVVVWDSKAAAMAWFSATFLTMTIVGLVVSLSTFQRHRVFMADVAGSGTSLSIQHADTFLGAGAALLPSTTAFPLLVSSSASGSASKLHASGNMAGYIFLASVTGIAAWAMGLTVFLSPIYVGLILLVITKVFSIMFLLDIVRRHQARVRSALQHLVSARVSRLAGGKSAYTTPTLQDASDDAAAVQQSLALHIPTPQEGGEDRTLGAVHAALLKAVAAASASTDAGVSTVLAGDVAALLSPRRRGTAWEDPEAGPDAVTRNFVWLLGVAAEVESAGARAALLERKVQAALQALSYGALCCACCCSGRSRNTIAPHAAAPASAGSWTTSTAAATAPEGEPTAVVPEKKGERAQSPGAPATDAAGPAPGSSEDESTGTAYADAQAGLRALYVAQLETERRASGAQRQWHHVEAHVAHVLFTEGVSAAKRQTRDWRAVLEWVSRADLAQLTPHVQHGATIATLRAAWIDLTGIRPDYRSQPMTPTAMSRQDTQKAFDAITSHPTPVPPVAAVTLQRLSAFLSASLGAAGQAMADDAAELQRAYLRQNAQTEATAQARSAAALQAAAGRVGAGRGQTPSTPRRPVEAKPVGGWAVADSVVPAPQGDEQPAPGWLWGGGDDAEADEPTPSAGDKPGPGPGAAASPPPAAAAGAGAGGWTASPEGADTDFIDYAAIRGDGSEAVDEEALALVMAQLREIEAAFKETGEAWTDPDFGGPDSLGPNIRTTVQKEWLRPAQYSPSPTLFEGSCSPEDGEQGALGDCYLLTSAAIVAHDPNSRIEDILIAPRPQFAGAGVFVVRLFKNSKWTPILVDDRLPCREGCFYLAKKPAKLYAGNHSDPDRKGRTRYALPAFARSRSRCELWPSILEKAYAKHAGSYSAIAGGLVHSALVDLTGGFGDWVNMKDPAVAQDIESGALWSNLLSWSSSGFLLGCGSNAGSDNKTSPLGIVQGHAYAIMDCKEFSDSAGQHRLLQLVNPWAKGEWKGAWSDVDTASWSKKAKRLLNYDPATADDDDGEFWMSFEDFVREFRNVYLVRRFAAVGGPPRGVTEEPWYKYQVRGRWEGEAAGGCTNFADTCWRSPQFLVKPSAPSALFVSLSQSVPAGAAPVPIGMKLLDNGEKRAKFVYAGEVAAQAAYSPVQEVTFEASVEPASGGKAFVLFVSTFDPGEERDFTLTVFSRKRLEGTVPAQAGSGSAVFGSLQALDSSTPHNG